MVLRIHDRLEQRLNFNQNGAYPRSTCLRASLYTNILTRHRLPDFSDGPRVSLLPLPDIGFSLLSLEFPI